jgi:hypothetical protein
MANQRWSRRIQVAAASTVIFAAACNDAPVAPEQHPAVLPPPRNYASAISGSAVTIVDEYDGESYTLNTQTREITRGSDGAILELDPEQAAAAATAFYGDAIVDAVLNDFSTLCSPENPCGAAMGGTLGDESGFLLTRESEDSRTHRGTRFGVSPLGSPPMKPFKSSSRSLDLMSGGTCSDIINSVFQGRIDYSAHRTDFVRDGFISGVLVGVGYLGRRVLPVGSIPAIRFMEKIAASQERRIAVSILGWMWNSYYCGSQSVTAGPVIRGFGGGGFGGTGGYLACHTETWRISFDGGKTSSSVSVEVCEFMMA